MNTILMSQIYINACDHVLRRADSCKKASDAAARNCFYNGDTVRSVAYWNLEHAKALYIYAKIIARIKSDEGRRASLLDRLVA